MYVTCMNCQHDHIWICFAYWPLGKKSTEGVNAIDLYTASQSIAARLIAQDMLPMVAQAWSKKSPQEDLALFQQ